VSTDWQARHLRNPGVDPRFAMGEIPKEEAGDWISELTTDLSTLLGETSAARVSE
jgi:hypothetical protein